jgi:hypothetical protein
MRGTANAEISTARYFNVEGTASVEISCPIFAAGSWQPDLVSKVAFSAPNWTDSIQKSKLEYSSSLPATPSGEGGG